jgi:hypothetical protein
MSVATEAKTIEEFLRSREHHPILSRDVFKDLCRRIIKLEKKK